jgi:uncharacterized protein YndB with AHSA1/START domain
MAAKNKPNELYINRLYDAPVKMVWDAWTDPKQVAQWWGPRGFTLTNHSKDVRTGGTWIYTMHGPDGVDYPTKTVFLEVEKYSRLVYDHGIVNDGPAAFRVTVLFTEVQGKTKMEMTMALATAEAASETKKFIKKVGGDSTWDRLAEFLSEKTVNKDIFVIHRTFEASLNTVYDMFANPEHLSQWLPPTGTTMKIINGNIKSGDGIFWRMEGVHGTMYGKAKYLEMVRPNRIVYTQQFSTEDGSVSRHPLSPTWPETMLTTITLTDDGPDKTRLTVQWEPYGNITSEERETFKKSRGGMTQGWTGSFDKLEAYLATR